MYAVVQIEREIEEYTSNILLLQAYIKNLNNLGKSKSEVALRPSKTKKIGVEIYKVQDYITFLSNKLAGAYLHLTFDENEYLNTEEK